MSARLTSQQNAPILTLMRNLYAVLGGKLKEARRKAGLTQDQLARRVSLSRTSITNIESGTQAVQIHQLYQIAAEIGISPQDLLPAQDTVAIETPVPKRLLRSLDEDEQAWVQRVARKNQH